MPLGDLRSKFYLRFQVVDKPGVLGRIAQTLGRHGISILSVHQKESHDPRSTPVVILTYEANERDLRRALKDIDITTLARVLLDLLRAKLNVQVYTVSHALPMSQRVLEHAGVHIHVGHLAAGTRAAISRVNANFTVELLDGNAVARISGRRHHRTDLIEIDLENSCVLSIRIAVNESFANFLGIEPARAHDVFERHFVRFNDSGGAAGLDGHVRQRGAFVHRPIL